MKSTSKGKPSEQVLRALLAKGKPIFHRSELVTAAKRCSISPERIKKIISALVQKGWILRLRRELYMIHDPLSDRMMVHPFSIAVHLIQPSVISHWSAAHHHGLTEQIPQIITASTIQKVITPSMRDQKAKKSAGKHIFEINYILYEFITIQKKHFYGIEKIWIDEYSRIPITDKERTLLDIFVYSKMFGGIGESFGIIENSLNNIDVNKLIRYAIQYRKKSVIKRLGWILENMGIPKKVLNPLLRVSISYYCRLDPSGPAKGKCDKRWMIQNNLRTQE